MMRSKWAKSRARAARSQEEVMLLKEEMRRTLESLAWEAEEWKKRAVKRAEQATLEDGLKDGLRAYAMRQSNIQISLAAHFRSLWEAPLKDRSENIDSTTPPTAANTNTANELNAADEVNDDEDEDEGLGSDAREHDSYNPEEDL